MSTYFSATVDTMLSGREVHCTFGVWFDFLSGVERVWLGRGTFTDKQGNEWLGMGELASIEGVQMSPMLSTQPVTMTLNGLDTTVLGASSFVDLVRTQATEIRGRRCAVYILFFDANFAPLDNPFLAELYIMDKASLTVDGESNTMTVTLEAEPLFAQKHIPTVSYVTDQDQRAAYPADKAFERVSLLNGKQTVVWSADA